MIATTNPTFALLLYLSFLSLATSTLFFGTFFNDYNANGIRDTSSPGFYEGGAVNIPVQLKSCDDSSRDVVVAITYTNDEGQYYFNISESEDGYNNNDESRVGCYYLFVDVNQYSLSPSVSSGAVTQMITNQVDPDSGRSEEEMLQPGDGVVWNVGIVSKSSSFEQESFDAVAEKATSTPATATDAVFITTVSPDYTDSVFSSNGTDYHGIEMTDNLDNHTLLQDIADNQTSLPGDTDYHLTTSTTIATDLGAHTDNPTIDPIESILTSNGDGFFLPDGSNDTVTDIVNNLSTHTFSAEVFYKQTSTTPDSFDQAGTLTTHEPESIANNENVNVSHAESIVQWDSVNYDVPSNPAPVPVPTKRPTSFFWTNVQSPTPLSTSSSTASTTFSRVSSTAAIGTNATVSGTTTSVFNDDEEAHVEEEHSPQDANDYQEEGGKGSISSLPSVSPTGIGIQSASLNATDIAVNTMDVSTDTNTTKSTNDTNNTSKSEPSVIPTPKPTLCVGCELHVHAIVRVELDNIASKLNDDSRSLFESVCSSFLEDQLSIATPPISNVSCVVVDQSFKALSPSRVLRSDYNRKLSQVYLADVNVTGTALSTKLHQTPESIKLKELCVGTFTVQGIYFVRALHEAEQNSGSDDAVFQSVQSARGVMTYDASQASQAGEEIDEPANPDAGRLSSGALAAIAASSVFCLMGFLMIFMIRTLDSRRHMYTNMDEKSGNANSDKSREFAESPNNDLLTLSPTSSNATGPTVITPVSIRSNTNEVEANIIPESFSGTKEERGQSKRSTLLNSRVRRDIVAPPGKLGVLVADTTGCGPAVHTVRKGSPMEGLIFVNDIIIAINGINTRNYSATQITKIMNETIDQERKITALSSVR
ncbi:hypothetical protein ACHAW6_005934 [Cyclotella cf. meneghiniana]